MVPEKTGKWTREYWTDLAERVGATLVGALLAVLTATNTTPIDWSAEVAWALLGIPTLVSLLKGLLTNLNGTVPSASAVNVTSHRT